MFELFSVILESTAPLIAAMKTTRPVNENRPANIKKQPEIRKRYWTSPRIIAYVWIIREIFMRTQVKRKMIRQRPRSPLIVSVMSLSESES